LKYLGKNRYRVLYVVSNPWREAIEEVVMNRINVILKVSNPWREAIEGPRQKGLPGQGKGFQSLEGGY